MKNLQINWHVRPYIHSFFARRILLVNPRHSIILLFLIRRIKPTDDPRSWSGIQIWAAASHPHPSTPNDEQRKGMHCQGMPSWSCRVWCDCFVSLTRESSSAIVFRYIAHLFLLVLSSFLLNREKVVYLPNCAADQCQILLCSSFGDHWSMVCFIRNRMNEISADDSSWTWPNLNCSRSSFNWFVHCCRSISA